MTEVGDGPWNLGSDLRELGVSGSWSAEVVR